jgi:hypothetical protein
VAAENPPLKTLRREHDLLRFEVLPGLPPYGPPAISFTKNGPREQREGLVVRFYPKGAKPWVGNFVGGMTACTIALDHPNNTDVIVVARGEACIVDPDSQTIRASITADVKNVFPVPALELVLLEGIVDFQAIKADNTGWRSNRISWDGFRNVQILGTELLGEAYDPTNAGWTPFNLDLLTGHCANSIYEKDMTRAVQVIPRRPSEAQLSTSFFGAVLRWLRAARAMLLRRTT